MRSFPDFRAFIFDLYILDSVWDLNLGCHLRTGSFKDIGFDKYPGSPQSILSTEPVYEYLAVKPVLDWSILSVLRQYAQSKSIETFQTAQPKFREKKQRTAKLTDIS